MSDKQAKDTLKESEKGKKPKLTIPLVAAVEQTIRKHFALQRNMLNNQLEAFNAEEGKFVRVSEDDVYRRVLYAGLGDFKLPEFRSLMRSDFIPKYDPFAEKFKMLPKWNKLTDSDYIKEFTGYITTDDPAYLEIQLKKWMVRAIRCALEPGKPNRTVFVLYGGQDIGKSWLWRWFSSILSGYYSETPIRDNKDSLIKLTENYIINLEELADLSLVSVSRLKQVISLAFVKERRPYAAEEISMQRRCSFVSSTNKIEFLIDDENTRWIIIKVQDIKKEYKEKLNVENLWAQAYALYQDSTFDCELTLSEQKKRDEINEDFAVIAPEHDAVVRYMQACKKDDDGAQFMTKAEILDYLHRQTMLLILGDGAREVLNPIKMNPYAVIQALHKEKFVRDRMYINGVQHRGYWVRLIDIPKVSDRQTKLAFDEKDFCQPQAAPKAPDNNLENSIQAPSQPSTDAPLNVNDIYNDL